MIIGTAMIAPSLRLYPRLPAGVGSYHGQPWRLGTTPTSLGVGPFFFTGWAARAEPSRPGPPIGPRQRGMAEPFVGSAFQLDGKWVVSHDPEQTVDKARAVGRC